MLQLELAPLYETLNPYLGPMHLAHPCHCIALAAVQYSRVKNMGFGLCSAWCWGVPCSCGGLQISSLPTQPSQVQPLEGNTNRGLTGYSFFHVEGIC